MVVGLLGRKVGMTQIFDSDRPGDPGDRDPGRSVPRPPGADAAEATATKPFNWAISTSPVVLPAAPLAATSPNSIASGKSAAPPPASRPSPRPIASRSDSFASSADVAADGVQVGQELQGRRLRRGQGGRRRRHQQGPRHRRRDEAAQLPRPAGHARREEGPSPRRLDRLQHRSAPRLQGPPHGRPLWRRHAAPPAISRSSASIWKTICCWSAAPCPGPTAATW